MRAPLALGLLAGLALACGRAPAARTAPEATRAPAPKELDAVLDRVEERLLAGQATVALWRELRERHEGIAAVTCSTLQRQARSMELVAARDAMARPSKRIRLAARGGPRERAPGHAGKAVTAAAKGSTGAGVTGAAGTGSAAVP